MFVDVSPLKLLSSNNSLQSTGYQSQMCYSLKMIDYIASRIIPDVADLKIKREKICRQDTSFMKKVRSPLEC